MKGKTQTSERLTVIFCYYVFVFAATTKVGLEMDFEYEGGQIPPVMVKFLIR